MYIIELQRSENFIPFQNTLIITLYEGISQTFKWLLRKNFAKDIDLPKKFWKKHIVYISDYYDWKQTLIT